MAETTVKIINRYDFIDNWERVNPKLEIGEIVTVAYPNGDLKLKVGIGSLFNNTPFYDSRLEIRIEDLEDQAARTKTFLSPSQPNELVDGDIWFDNS